MEEQFVCLKTYYAKHLTSICSISIVKRGYLLLSIFRALNKQNKIEKIQNFWKKCWKKKEYTHIHHNAQEIAKDYLRKIKMGFDNIFSTKKDPIDKENSSLNV